MTRVVVVGAGPAGVAASRVLLRRGVSPVLIDEGSQPGGQVYRRPPDAVGLDMRRLLGRGHSRFRRFHDEAEHVASRVDYRPESLAFAVHDGAVWVNSAAHRAAELRYEALILATGATDRTMPVRGWTLPGVYALGGAQAILKGQGCFVGRDVVFCGSSPLLYLVAAQYLRLGGRVAAVLDTTPFGKKLSAVPRLLVAPGVLAEGLLLLAELRRSGVRVEHGVRILEFVGGGSALAAVRFRDRRGRVREIACDAAAVGHGLRPETQLADLAGCAFRYSPRQMQWFPELDGTLQGAPGVYVAGDGAAIGGAEAAAIGGALAATSVLGRLGVPSGLETGALRRRLARLHRFQAGMSRAFAWPSGAADEIGDDVVVCRCEAVTAGQLRRAARQSFGPRELNRLKAMTRCGMGRCQGRFCELAAAEIASARLGAPRESYGRLRSQAPVKPLSVATVATAHEAGPDGG